MQVQPVSAAVHLAVIFVFLIAKPFRGKPECQNPGNPSVTSSVFITACTTMNAADVSEPLAELSETQWEMCHNASQMGRPIHASFENISYFLL